jgi:death-on-curing protein
MDDVRYLTVPEALVIYAEIIRASRVRHADVQSVGGLESALYQPQQSFEGRDLYPTLEAKAAALLYSLCQNHPFTDGNKRVAFIATRTFLRLNGFDLAVETYEAKEVMYSVAKGEMSAAKIADWIRSKLCEFCQ